MVRVITVFGATGNQGESARSLRVFPDMDQQTNTSLAGGAVAKLLLQYPDEYQVRAVTRNPKSDAAKALLAKGARVVEADLTVPSSLPLVLEGCWGVFGVTNFYDGEP